jgi:ABC-2 type transport system ATP-binding protein
MQKKLGLACTLIHEPEILYLDEPTTGVDPVSRREFWDILTNLHVQGVTILVSTPYMDEAERCSRVGLIYNGGLIACDTPQGIKKQVPGKALALHTSDRFKAREVLRATPGIHEVQSYGELLHIFADSLESGEALARAGLAGAGIEIRDLRPIEARMEEAFISLIRRQELEEERPAAS